MITITEALILSLLSERVSGAFGSELMHASNGKLKRGSVYALLGRLEKAGLVTSHNEAGTDASTLPRVRYRMTDEGHAARMDLADWVGLGV